MAETPDSDLTANAFQQHETRSAILSVLGALTGLFLIQGESQMCSEHF